MFREHRKHPLSVADLLPWGALVAPGVVANKDGSLLAGFEYWGPDLDSATEHEIAAVQRTMSQALSGLGNDWVVHADAIRAESTTYPAGGAFPDPVTALIDEESRTAYQISAATSKRTSTSSSPGSLPMTARAWSSISSSTMRAPRPSTDRSISGRSKSASKISKASSPRSSGSEGSPRRTCSATSMPV